MVPFDCGLINTWSVKVLRQDLFQKMCRVDRVNEIQKKKI